MFSLEFINKTINSKLFFWHLDDMKSECLLCNINSYCFFRGYTCFLDLSSESDRDLFERIKILAVGHLGTDCYRKERTLIGVQHLAVAVFLYIQP